MSKQKIIFKPNLPPLKTVIKIINCNVAFQPVEDIITYPFSR